MNAEPLPSQIREALAVAPWLEPFVEPDDRDIEPAMSRFDRAQAAAIRKLEADGVIVHRRLEHDGILTTALDVEKRP